MNGSATQLEGGESNQKLLDNLVSCIGESKSLLQHAVVNNGLVINSWLEWRGPVAYGVCLVFF